MCFKYQRINWTFLLLLLAFFCLSGCYSSKVVASVETDELVPHRQTHWTYLWGLVEQDYVEANCPNESISYITVQDNFFANLLNVITVGIVNPVTLEWHCMPDATSDGESTEDSILDTQIDSLQ